MRRSIAMLAVLAIAVSCAWAQNKPANKPAAKPEATTKPATNTSTKPAASQPAKPKPTPEQQDILDTYNRTPANVATAKLDTNIGSLEKPNDNFCKIEKGFKSQHENFLKRKAQPMDLLFIGDSITAGWNGKGKDIFKNEYSKYKAANFGISGDRTQHVLWRIENGELDGLKTKPKVVVIMIGTNNSGANSSDQIATGVKEIVNQVRTKLPESKILLLGIFPRSASPVEKNGRPSALRAKLQNVNTVISKLDDGKNIRFLEIWKEFLAEDGALTKEIMPDALHPNEKGYQIWADTMRPLLEEMMK